MTKLGQHFLKNKTKLQKIVEALELKDNDTIIEIGPGHGELTREIIKKAGNQEIKKFKIIAIEKDGELVDKLRNLIEIEKLGNCIEIIEGDILKILPQLVSQFLDFPISNYKVVGNIPYYITGYLFRVLGELENKPSSIVLLIQKEVAERIVANPPKMNLLAASAQFWAEPKIIGYIGKKDFKPAPKVDSAIIKLLPTRIYADRKADLCGKYYKFIKILFKQPRKTILNNISKFQSLKVSKKEIMEKLEKIGINPQARPQDLSIEKIIKLSTIIS